MHLAGGRDEDVVWPSFNENLRVRIIEANDITGKGVG